MKRTFKKWITYKIIKLFVRSRRTFKRALKTIDPSTKGKLNDLQKPLYDICIKLIGESTTQLRSNSIDYVYHIESDKYLVIIKPNNDSNREIYSVSLIEYKDDSKNLLGFVEIAFPPEEARVIIHKFEKETQKRMKTKQIQKTVKVANHLNEILKEMSEECL
jgi:hypothetical protein